MKNNNNKAVFYIKQNDFKLRIENLSKPTPTIFESVEDVEVRFNVELTDQNSFNKYHALDGFVDDKITVGLIYENGLELKSTFQVQSYERRFGNLDSAVVTHVLKGLKEVFNN
jgi:hypothetical protein